MPRFMDDPDEGIGILGKMLRHWLIIELDFQEIYGIDLSTPGLLERRSWRWMTLRMHGLLSTEGRVQRVLNPTDEQKKAAARRSG